MAGNRDKTLARLLRVRTLQLGLSRAEEARAHQRFAGEAALRTRIGQLAEAVAPASTETAAFSLVAAAHFRDRLQQSAEAAEARLNAAQAVVERAAEATRSAKRDQTAIEKLIERADADAAIKAIRELEKAPSVRKIRHDPC
jgi:flagellar FliJ protein